jgi:HPt (histidine-containing phosphotransfer) domain-containing protein
MHSSKKPADHEILDDQVLLMITEGDSGFRAEILASFISSAEVIIAEIVAAPDAKTRQEKAHKLKGLAASVGAVILQQASAIIEADPSLNIAANDLATSLTSALHDVKTRI